MFMLLSGSPPFQGTTDEDIMANVKKQEFSFEGSDFVNISENAKDLIRKILVPEDQRISALEALAHPWFVENPFRKTVTKAVISAVTHNLLFFRGSFQLKETIRAFILSQIVPLKEIKAIREVFSIIDTDHDGKISEPDLFDYLKQTVSQEDAIKQSKSIIKHIDFDKRGYIEYSQYLRAGLDSGLIFTRNNLIIAFKMLDNDKQGYINAEKLMHGLSSSFNNVETWKRILAEAKISDGPIDLQKFLEVLLD